MLAYLLLTSLQSPAGAEARFADFMRRAKTVSADLHMTVTSNKAPGEGTIRIMRPNHLLFKMKWGPSNYSFSIKGSEIVAIEHGNKIYREYGDIGEMFIPDNDISQTPDLGFPSALMAGTIRAMVPQGIAFKPTGKSTVSGVSVDQLTATWSTQTGQITVRTKIDPQGRMLEWEREYNMGQKVLIKVRVDNYRVNEPMKSPEFATPVPLGFVPETLPTDAYPINYMEPMVFEGWQRMGGGGTLKALAQKKVLFVAIGDPDCEVSRKAARTVDLLAKSVESKGGISAAISLNSSSRQTPVFRTVPNFFDPKGGASDKLRAPGSPMFLLVAPNGRITRVWYGFDVAKTGEFSADVLEWVEKSKHPEKLNPGEPHPEGAVAKPVGDPP